MARSVLPCLIVAMLAAAEPSDPLDAARFLPSATGLLVTLVVPGSEAQRVGVRRGDILTGYAGKPLRGMDDLRAAVAAAAGTVEVAYARAGVAATATVTAGKLGVSGRPAEAGVAIELLPASTGAKPDFAALAAGPRATWYVFSIRGRAVGCEYQRAERVGDELRFASEVCFDSAPQWSLQHFVEENALALAPELRPLRLRHALPLADWQAAAQAEDKDGRRTWSLTVTAEAKAESESAALAAGALPDYVAAQLPAFLPRQAGACLHYRMLTAHGAADRGLHAIVAVGEEEVAVGAQRLRAWRFEQRSADGVGRVSWVADGVVVRHDYGNDTVAWRAGRDEALRGLDKRFVLTLAK